jgi:hypothetical protein
LGPVRYPETEVLETEKTRLKKLLTDSLLGSSILEDLLG